MMVGAALAFHRFFPQESAWYGFIVPPLGLVILLNFIEHFIALPNLLILWPAFGGLLLWLVVTSKVSHREVLLPAVVFLATFAFTFGIRCLQPDIIPSSDGLADLTKINNFCQGDTLPPTDTWLPPYKFEWYYAMQHYAASIIKRMFDLKIGVAYNLAHALLSSLTCVAGAAAAWRISGGRTWITLAVPFLIESAMTGSSAIINLTMWNPAPSLWYADNLSGGVIDYENAKGTAHPMTGLLWSFLDQTKVYDQSGALHHERLELQVPGFWTWRDEYHANSSGHFLTLLGVFSIAEIAAARRAIWPWVMAALIPIFAVVASTWAWPITLLTCGGMIAIGLVIGRRPAHPGLTILIFFTGLLLLWPALYNVTSSPEVPAIVWTQPWEGAPWREFLVQWWPIIFLWLYGCFYIREISPAIRWVLIVIPLTLIGVEWICVEGRYNTVEKMWGYAYGIGLIALFPIVASRANIACRLLTLVLLTSAMLSMFGWLRNASNWMPWGPWHDAEFQLEGNHYLMVDDQKRRILQTLTQVKHATFLTGKSIDFNYYESPAVAVFTENRSYSTWTYFESVANYADEAYRREKQNNDFYSGAMTNHLQFLQQQNITGVIIWPDNDIPNDYLTALTTELAPSYEYIDCKGNGDKNAGVFMLRPLPASR
jgi:hypothetical protein